MIRSSREEGEYDPVLQQEGLVAIWRLPDWRERITYSQPLCIIGLASREESFQGVVARDDKTSQVGKELSGQVEDNEEEVESSQADNSVGLGHTSLLLDVVEGRVLGKLYVFRNGWVSFLIPWQELSRWALVTTYLPVKSTQVVLDLILGRHDC